jgi:alpha-beta hydrolase superfamily lysophospholipase
LTPRDGETTVRTVDGLDLFGRALSPEDPRGTLVFVHGLFEHSGRYLVPMRYFAERGWATVAFDHRGHGRSPGPRVHIRRFDEFIWDLEAALAAARAARPGRPLFVVGHSHGGLVAILFALRAPGALSGLALSSPFLGIPAASRPGAARVFGARVLSLITPRVRLDTGLDAAGISRDPAVVAAYSADPLIGRKVSARWYTEVLLAFERAATGAPLLRLPTLLQAAGQDRIADPEATREFLSRAPAPLVEAVWWDALYHELFNEPEKEAVFARLAGWLEAHAGLD